MSRPTHQWETSGVKHMTIEEEDVGALDLPIVIDANETERFVESLKKFDVDQVGSSAWMEQHRRLEQLNLQAHQNAMTNSDEYVLEAFLTFEKLECLLHDLLTIEVWKEQVYPLLRDTLVGRNTMRLYFVFYHEATVINLLEVFLYHKHVCEAAGEKMIDFVDYVVRKLTVLNASASSFRDQLVSNDKPTAENAAEFAKQLASRSPIEELAQHLKEIEFKVCVSCVAVARFLCESADVMPLSVVSRITDTHDLLVLLVPLIENPPWTRRLANGKWEKLIDNAWKEVAPIDLLKITKVEGQPWLAMYHLLAKDVFRERYHLNTFRKGQALRVRKYINDVMLDQLPFLADIQRYMDELAITEVPEPHSTIGGSNGVFMFQQVAVLREAIVKGRQWDQVAATQLQSVFTMTDRTDADLLKMAELYSNDLTEGVMETGYSNDVN